MATPVSNPTWPGWETVRLIGHGSFGAVYEIRRVLANGETDRAALKVISIPQNSSDVDELYGEGFTEESITDTFRQYMKNIISEYTLMQRMNGTANVVNCHDIREVEHENGVGWDIYIRMELLTPLIKTLDDVIPEERVVRIGVDLCKALVLCRKYNIVHRDIKPANIFLSDNGDYKLGDFGVAKTVEMTTGGTKIGTYEYMAPEVYHEEPYGSAADIYSLGMVLYWLLNERRTPFLKLPPELPTGSDKDRARKTRFGGAPIPPPAHGSDALKQIVLKACAYEPKDRWQSAEEMLRALETMPAGSAPAYAPAAPTPAPYGAAEEGTWALFGAQGMERPEAYPAADWQARGETTVSGALADDGSEGLTWGRWQPEQINGAPPRQSGTKTCVWCGNRLDDAAAFCIYCGRPVESGIDAPTVMEPSPRQQRPMPDGGAMPFQQPPQPPQRKKKGWIWGIAAAAVVVIGLAAVFLPNLLSNAGKTAAGTTDSAEEFVPAVTAAPSAQSTTAPATAAPAQKTEAPAATAAPAAAVKWPNANADGTINLDRIAHFDENYDYTRNPRYKLAYIAASGTVLYQLSADAYKHWCPLFNLEWAGFFSSDGDSDLYLNMLQTQIDQGVRGFILDPDSTIFPTVLNVLEQHPDVCWMSQMSPPRDGATGGGVPTGGNLINNYVGFDNVESGREVTRRLVQWKNETYPNVPWSEVGFLMLDFSYSPALHDRYTGSLEVFTAAGGRKANFFHADCVSTGLSMQGAINAAGPIVASHPEIKCWLCNGLFDDAAQAAAYVFSTQGLTDVAAVGVFGGSALIQQWDAGQQDCFRFAIYTAQTLYAEPIIGAVAAYLNGWATPDSIWPSWVWWDDHGGNLHTYSKLSLPVFALNHDNYKKYLEWTDLYTHADAWPYDREVTVSINDYSPYVETA